VLEEEVELLEVLDSLEEEEGYGEKIAGGGGGRDILTGL
jgi:hypothetical protein